MELARFPLRGGFSVQSIFTFALTVIITVLLWVVLAGAPAQAATVARWTDGDAILFDNHAYNRDESFTDATGTIPDGAAVYKAPVQTEGTDQTLMVIYFGSGVDPPTATAATYVAFDYSNGRTANPHDSQNITMVPQGQDDSMLGEINSSCSVSGIGWMICPISVFLAESMDWIYTVIEQFVVTPPIMMETENNAMYTAWNITRSVANVAFVIVFLVIIYSQLTSLGVSNYGLKKLTPRLIVAAVLVNLSFYISALAIDISNIIGYSINDIFIAIRESVFQLNDDNFAAVNNNPWASVTAVVLAGGGAIGGIYYLVTAGPFLIVTLLVGLALLALFVLLILAARQAVIVLLVIVSPLAFVANLLPNTEKWFDKWKDLFMTMLIFFPAFALVFGGSQLAGQIIIQNANGNIITVILGLAVQVAPLVITPYLLKLSGGLIGRIAQIANNPRKGIMDRTKGWQHEKNEIQRQRVLASKRGIAKPFQIIDNNRKARKSLTESYQKNADSRWEESKRYKKLSERAAAADLNKERVHSEHSAHIDALKAGRGHASSNKFNLHNAAMQTEAAKTDAELASAQLSATTSAYRAGAYDTRGNSVLTPLQTKMAENVIQAAAWKQAELNNQYVQQRAVSTEIRNNSDLLDIAQGSGSVEMRGIGRDRAQANAIATLTKLNKDARDNVISLMETEAIESGDTVKDFAIKNVFAKANSPDAAKRAQVSRSRLEAALEIAIADGQVGVFDEARASEHIDQELVDAVVARNTGTFKAKGGFHVQAHPELSLQRYIKRFNDGDFDTDTTVNSLDDVRKRFAQDVKMERLSTLSNTTSSHIGDVKMGAFVKFADDMPSLLDAIPTGADGRPISRDHRAMVERIFRSTRDALEDPSTRATMSDRIDEAMQIEEAIRNKFYPQYEKPVLTNDPNANTGEPQQHSPDEYIEDAPNDEEPR